MNLINDSIEDIKRKIQEAINNGDGEVTITDLDLDYANGTIQLLKTVNNGNELVMEESRIDTSTDNSKVILNGRITFLNEERMAAHASFYIDNNQTEIMLEIELPNDWVLKNSFPTLPPSRLNNSTDNNRTRESYLYDIRLDHARFFFTSHDRRYQPLNLRLKRGLSLYGKLKFNGITKWLENYIGDPIIFGLLDNGEDDVLVELKAKLSTINMQSISFLNAELVFLSRLREISVKDLSTVGISGDIEVENNKVSIHSNLYEEELTSLIFKEKVLNNIDISNLKKLAPIVGRDDLETILPTGLQNPYYLQINGIEICFNALQNTITYVKVLVSTAKYWYIFDGHEVRRIQFEFVAVSPFSPARNISGLISGRVRINDEIELKINSKIPDGTFIEGEILGTTTFREIAEEFIGTWGHGVPEFTCNKFYITIDEKKREFNLRADTEEMWNIPLGITVVDVINVRLDIGGPYNKKRDAIISGVVDIDNNLFDISQDVLGEGSFNAISIVEKFSLRSLLEKLCGSNIYPKPLPDLVLKDMVFTITSPMNGSRIKLSATIEYFGNFQIEVGKYLNNWNFIGMLNLADEWKLSNISGDFKELDFLKFTKPRLIISSFTDPTIEDPSGIKGVVKGISFRGNLHMLSGGLDIIDHLLGIKELPLDTYIPEDPSDTRLKARFDNSFDILGITFYDFNLFIKPKPNLTVEVSLSATVKIFSDSLDFLGKFGITQGQSEMSLALRGTWKEPFGFVGLEIKNAFLGMITGPQNTIAVAGDIDFGENLSISVKGEFIGNSVPSAIIGSFSGQICLLQIIKAFTGYQIPNNYLDVCLSNLGIYVVGNPLGATINDIHYDPGFRISGEIKQFGIEAKADIAIDYRGILLEGEMTPIKIDNILEITGCSAAGGPIVILEAYEDRFLFQLNAHLMILGLSQDTEIFINKNNFHFKLEGKIFNVFEAIIEANAAGDLKNGDFIISATMKQDMLDFMVEETKKIFVTNVGNASEVLDAAEKKWKEAKEAVDWLNKKIIEVEKKFDKYKKEIVAKYEEAKNSIQPIRDKIKSLEDDKSSWLDKLDKLLGGALSKAKKEIRKITDLIDEWSTKLEKVIRDSNIYKEILDNLVPPPILETLKNDLVIAKIILKTEKDAFDAAKILFDKLDKVGDFIINTGEEALLNIRSISFTGKVRDVGHGDVDLSITGDFMGSNFSLSINFDFHDPISGVEALYKKLLDRTF
ncbi:hypothetical protein CN605_27970 [Bacillus toyonensis]|uniref:hypothetical protein n=1 Tax=Bacillus toyonensis TaxID=155322 RepID=UPI000BF0FFA5|nr:hypothetical protein [Bacillus toyonensis]PEL35492.1 hypothetical protein CN605_27970 [Bacillus toyonensis]